MTRRPGIESPGSQVGAANNQDCAPNFQLLTAIFIYQSARIKDNVWQLAVRTLVAAAEAGTQLIRA